MDAGLQDAIAKLFSSRAGGRDGWRRRECPDSNRHKPIIVEFKDKQSGSTSVWDIMRTDLLSKTLARDAPIVIMPPAPVGVIQAHVTSR